MASRKIQSSPYKIRLSGEVVLVALLWHQKVWQKIWGAPKLYSGALMKMLAAAVRPL